jgi:Trk K+ transport system NAD-binding subunit
MTKPFILCGLGRTGSRVLEYLRTAGLSVVVVDNRCREGDPRLQGVRLVSGDCRDLETLRKAGVEGALGVLVMTNDDLVNISTTLQVRNLDRAVRIVVRLFDQNLLAQLGQTLENVFALSTAVLTAPVLAMTAVTGPALGTFRIEGQPEGRLVAESVVRPGDNLGGRTISEVTESASAVALAHVADGGKHCLLHDIELTARLAPGDRLVLCGEPRSLSVVGGPRTPTEHDLEWAPWLWRMVRVARNTLEDMDRAVLICAIVLVVVLLVSTLVLHFGVTAYRVPDALLRTVSIMATGGSMHEEEYKDLQGIRVFVSILRIVGAVLMAAFTAIVTNYLLRARLGGAFEARRIPERGHVVVCGLGSIGFQTVKELIGLGERVVAIERDPANAFVTAARRLGAAVLVADATLPEAQSQARMRTAYSVIVATSNDVSNLSIALLARQRQPEQRVVVLLTEPEMAKMLRQAAGVELALSVPMLAAPAFLAGLYGDRVLTVVLVSGSLLAVFEVVIHPEDPLAGQPLEKSAATYGFCPIVLLGPSGDKKTAGLLEPGDRVVAVAGLRALEALMHRQARAGSNQLKRAQGKS